MAVDPRGAVESLAGGQPDRLFAVLAPEGWTDAQLVRLGACVQQVLTRGENALRAIERALEEGPCCG